MATEEKNKQTTDKVAKRRLVNIRRVISANNAINADPAMTGTNDEGREIWIK